MISDSIFTIQRFVIPVRHVNEPIYLLPFGDIHRHAPLCDVEKWHEFLDWAKTKKNAYFLGMGDYSDFLSASERQQLNESSLHESTYQNIEELMTSQIKELCREISFMKGRIIGLIEGNHYGKFTSGMTSTQEMCKILSCPYLGVSSFIRLSFVYSTNRGYAIDIWAHHGKGASRTVGSSLNKIEQMSDAAVAQIYLMGHTHRKSVAPKSKLMLTCQGKGIYLSSRKILLANTGSFLQGYRPGAPSYIAKAGMTPTDIGVVKIELTPRKKKNQNNSDYYIDIHASV